eukprot:1371658-Amorphochlora_amoeboformis.AAC.2
MMIRHGASVFTRNIQEDLQGDHLSERFDKRRKTDGVAGLADSEKYPAVSSRRSGVETQAEVEGRMIGDELSLMEARYIIMT